MAKRPTKSGTAAAKAAKATNPGTSRTRSRRKRSPSTEDIAVRAYYIYEAEGGGDQMNHWLRAERELTTA